MGNCSSSPGKRGPKVAYKNKPAQGFGGKLLPNSGRTGAVLATFDYAGYGAERKGIPTLSCTPDGLHFQSLCQACDIEFAWFSDQRQVPSHGFPTKENIITAFKQAGNTLGPGDTFIFFYAGHGAQARDPTGQEIDGLNETMVFVTEEGNRKDFTDDELSCLIRDYFNPETRIVLVVDACHSGTIADFGKAEFAGRPYCSLAAVKDEQEAQDIVGKGGAFTSALLETVETMVSREGRLAFSCIELYNRTFQSYGSRFDRQDFQIEMPVNTDPDTLSWPLVPPKGWSVHTALDERSRQYVDQFRPSRPILNLCCFP
eukprot:TRINITY_DN97781_c0_g1_i1.p1 TRINITY_DN97781_c0_g1~~TRINITY_DN97781_c0_g1_i1.p1  ORF type:complete len:315 (+),score=25.54 TRINITY_DN97781_c0_g1_i1:88-1032(+)